MGFKLEPIKADKWELVFSDEPNYVHALEMAPESIEPGLRFGVWLVVTFPVWSTTARPSVLAAIDCAKGHGGQFQLGVRPLDAHEELRGWWPASDIPSDSDVLMVLDDEGAGRPQVHISRDLRNSPLWLVLRDGQVIHQEAGPRSKQQLNDLIGMALT